MKTSVFLNNLKDIYDIEENELKAYVNHQDFVSDIQAPSRFCRSIVILISYQYSNQATRQHLRNSLQLPATFHFVKFQGIHPIFLEFVIRDYANSPNLKLLSLQTYKYHFRNDAQEPIPVKMPKFSECWRCGNTRNTVVCQACEVAKYCSNACQRTDKFRHEAECKPVAIVKTCSSCRKSGSGLRACTGCYRVYYCDIKCQKTHRKEHKSACSGTKDKIEELAQRMFLYYEPRRQKIYPKHYYWGNYPAFDGVNLLENEGGDYSSDLKVLFLGVGDLRNVALTCARLPDTYRHVVAFTLNDRESCILARLVLFLYMLIQGEPGVEKMVTEVWYSILLGEQTYKYLLICLRALIDCPCAEDLTTKTTGLISINDAHLKELKNVWTRWHNLKVKGTTWIQRERQREFTTDAGSYHGRETYFSTIPQEHVKSAKKWMEDCVFKRNQTPTFAENPTLTGYNRIQGRRSYSYCIPSDVLPFTGWDYTKVKKFKHANSLVTMYGAYIENILRMVMRKLSSKLVRFEVLLCDCMAMEEFIEKEAKYDRILTTNLMDYIILPDLLILCSQNLNHGNPFATIVTETHNWTRDFYPEADVTGISNEIAECFKLGKTALEDTNNPRQVQDGGTGVREYLENSTQLNDFIRALFYTYAMRKGFEDGCAHTESPKVPTVKGLGKEFQLQLRDGFRYENRIAPFKMAVNRRRVTMITGLERIIEWVPLQSE